MPEPTFENPGLLGSVCPCCLHHLRYYLDAEGWFWVYCENGPCISAVSNDGARGRSLSLAVIELSRKICAEMETFEMEEKR